MHLRNWVPALFTAAACFGCSVEATDELADDEFSTSEGAIGVARTLLALGAPVVVASQWRVDSTPTRDLMIAFHGNRKQKRMTSAESLRQAQLELMNRTETSAPFYWAAFSLFGGYANY